MVEISCSDRDKDKITLNAIEKYRYGLRKTVPKHLYYYRYDNYLKSQATHSLLKRVSGVVCVGDFVFVFSNQTRFKIVIKFPN